jgi:Mg-chelatase subunit ChlD
MNASTVALVPGSLAQIAKQGGVSLAESFLSCDAVVLVDTSGSMMTKDSRAGQSRYDVAIEELTTLQKVNPGKVGVISFSSDVAFCPSGIPTPYFAGTDMAKALDFARIADVPGMRVIVVSDGEPDEPEKALIAAGKYHAHIDAVYVGPESSPRGRDFLQRLCAASGGQVVTADRVQQLAAKVQLLLS